MFLGFGYVSSDDEEAEVHVLHLNELEFVTGNILANQLTYDEVVIIDPVSGVVQHLYDFSSLHPDNEYNGADVLNRISISKGTDDKIFVTGKNWDLIFLVQIDQAEKVSSRMPSESPLKNALSSSSSVNAYRLMLFVCTVVAHIWFYFYIFC